MPDTKLIKSVYVGCRYICNYNMPYADIYYEVNEQYRRKGYGTLMVQELKKAAYLLGRLPAARCNINNYLSKATLLKAGFVICGHILTGELKPNNTGALKQALKD